jgi:hypothetical protein
MVLNLSFRLLHLHGSTHHMSATTTLEHCIKSVPESVRIAVESLDHLLKSKPGILEGAKAN